MDEPWTRANHPPTPAFERARRAGEHERQQRIARLTEDQSRDFSMLRIDQQRQRKALDTQQRRQWRGRMAEQMRKDMLQDRSPHLRHDSHRRQLKDSQDLRHAINDYLDGRTSRAANAYKAEMQRAYRTARSTVSREQTRERGQLRKDQMNERDAFLTRAEKARGEKAPDKSRDNAKGMADSRDQRSPDKPPRDPAWQRAFNRAAGKEARNEKTLDHDKPRDPRDDPDRTR